MRAALPWLLFAACTGERLVATPPPGAQTTLVAVGGVVHVLGADPAEPALLLEAPSAPVVLLYYTATPEGLALPVDEQGLLVLAGSEEPEARWPLPVPVSAERLLPGADALTALEPEAALGAAGDVEIPAPSCGALRFLTSVARVPGEGASVEGLAQRGELALLTVRTATSHRAYLVRDEGAERVSTLALEARGQLWLASADVDRFVIVTHTATRTASYLVDDAGRVALAWEQPSDPPVAMEDLRRFRDATTVFGRRDSDRSLWYLSPGGAGWTLLHGFPNNPRDPHCDPFNGDQVFEATGPQEGVISLVGLGPHRFRRDARLAEPILPGFLLPSPCHSATGRFASGELVVHLVGVLDEGGGRLELQSAWQPSGSDAWIVGDFPATLSRMQVFGDVAIAGDTQQDSLSDDVVLVAADARRPDRRPRVCARLGSANARVFAFDGQRGVVAIQERPGLEISVRRFELAPP